MTQTFKIIGLLIIAGVLGIVAMVIYDAAPRMNASASVTNFEECVAAGNSVMESYPAQCRSADGQLFVQDIPDSQTIGSGPGLQTNGCAVAGCSGQLCVSADEAGNTVTDCMYRAEYACYTEASCEPQADGKCGWTETPELKQCLANPPAVDLEVM